MQAGTGPGPWTFLVTAGLSLGCRAYTPPRFPNASCAFAQGQTGASPALLGSPKPSRISGCYLHGKNPIQCDNGVDFLQGTSGSGEGKERDFSVWTWESWHPSPRSCPGQAHTLPFSQEGDFFGEVSPRSYSSSALTAHSGFAGGKDKELPPAPHGTGDTSTSQPILACRPPGKGNSWLYCVTNIL